MTSPRIAISLHEQRLHLMDGDACLHAWDVSTARNGPGEHYGSECTPRGAHIVRARIGENLPRGAVLVGRRWTGSVWTSELGADWPGRDWILSRILWLSGREVGRNRLGNVDTMRRYIYIHGCPDDAQVGVPGSHGCIRMRNDDIIALFDIVKAGTRVDINE